MALPDHKGGLEPLQVLEARTQPDWTRFYIRRYATAIRSAWASEERGDPREETGRIMVAILNADDLDPAAQATPKGLSGNA